MKKEKKYIAILIIFILAIIASVILSFVSIEQACGGTQTGCYAVNTSQYEKTFGIKNGYIGLTLFSILAIITLLHIIHPSKANKRIIVTGIIFGTLFAIYFLYIQFFILKAICKYCMVIDLGMLINLGIIIFWNDTQDLNSLKWTN